MDNVSKKDLVDRVVNREISPQFMRQFSLESVNIHF